MRQEIISTKVDGKPKSVEVSWPESFEEILDVSPPEEALSYYQRGYRLAIQSKLRSEGKPKVKEIMKKLKENPQVLESLLKKLGME